MVDDVRILKPMFKQRLAANSKALVITDIGLFSVHSGCSPLLHGDYMKKAIIYYACYVLFLLLRHFL